MITNNKERNMTVYVVISIDEDDDDLEEIEGVFSSYPRAELVSGVLESEGFGFRIREYELDA
jgi:hypothetical protein